MIQTLTKLHYVFTTFEYAINDDIIVQRKFLPFLKSHQTVHLFYKLILFILSPISYWDFFQGHDLVF